MPHPASPARWNNTTITLALLILLAGGQGCSHETPLIPTPNLNLLPDGKKAFDAIPADQRNPEMEIIYAADRSFTRKGLFIIEFGTGRSGVLIAGTAKVGFDRPLSWDELVALSTSKDDHKRPNMRLNSATELGMLAVPLKEMIVREGRYVLSDTAKQQIDEGTAKLYATLHERLAKSARKDVYIFVHGFNNNFNDAVFRLAMAWHMAGRSGVPIAYTWPAGYGGLFGYAYDRESGEFTVSHLRRFLQVVAECPDVERIHLIAHSRGTDVAINALRELNIEYRAKDLATVKELKLADLVLAAPDVDAEVFEQRFAIEDLHLAASRTTVYLSRTDFALATSRWLFGGGNRLGNLLPQDFTPEARSKLSDLKNFYLINCNVSGYSTSHDYAFVHPAVVSDLILLLRDGKPPGAENGRPLTSQFQGVWEIRNDYLRTPP